MVNIDIEYEGSLHCLAVHGPSGKVIRTDAPVDNHGKGEFFSPTDLVATALGTCIATVMAVVAERDGIDLKGMKINVTKEMVSTPKRRIGKLIADILMPVSLTEEQKNKLQRTAHTCPVHASLHPDTKMEINFNYL